MNVLQPYSMLYPFLCELIVVIISNGLHKLNHQKILAPNSFRINYTRFQPLPLVLNTIEFNV